MREFEGIEKFTEDNFGNFENSFQDRIGVLSAFEEHDRIALPSKARNANFLDYKNIPSTQLPNVSHDFIRNAGILLINDPLQTLTGLTDKEYKVMVPHAEDILLLNEHNPLLMYLLVERSNIRKNISPIIKILENNPGMSEIDLINHLEEVTEPIGVESERNKYNRENSVSGLMGGALLGGVSVVLLEYAVATISPLLTFPVCTIGMGLINLGIGIRKLNIFKKENSGILQVLKSLKNSKND